MLSDIMLAMPRWREAVWACWTSFRRRERYVNFDVRVETTAKGYCAVVVLSFREARHEFDLSLKQEDNWQLPPDRSPGGPGVRRPAPELDRMRRLGDRLWRTLFVGKIHACFQRERQRAEAEGKGLRIRLGLTGARELARLPWELLFDTSQDQFLLHDPRLSLVRYLESAEPSARPGVRAPLHVLVAIAVPRDRRALGVEEELRWIKEALAELQGAKRVVLELLQPATLEKIEEYLRSKPCHIFHYIGHGMGGDLILEDGRGFAAQVEGRDLGILLGSHSSLRMVVLNACDSCFTDSSDAFAGSAQALVRQGVPAVVAMQSEISDQAAVIFTRRFYQELARGAAVDRAVADARQAMYLRRFRLAWAAPVLFTCGVEGPIIASRCPIVGLLALFLTALSLTLALALPENGWHFWYCEFFGRPARPPVLIKVNAEECPSPPGLNIPFVLIEPRPFRMGSNKGPDESRPEHEVTLSEPYCLSVFEVTEENWQAVMGIQSGSRRGDSYPITYASWDDANNFTRQLNVLSPTGNYRLPTEAQWEFAAREGVDAGTKLAPGQCIANCKEPGWRDCWLDVAPVGQFEPNALGLYDMVGNVGEWVADRYGRYDPPAVTDPKGSRFGSQRVWRGGAFNSGPQSCSSIARTDRSPTRQSEDTGFRIVRDPVLNATPASAPPALGKEVP